MTVMATMNIKDPRVHAMAHELAAIRHSSATAAVRAALEEALDRARANRPDRASVLAELQEEVADSADRWLGDADLYDDQGLPR